MQTSSGAIRKSTNCKERTTNITARGQVIISKSTFLTTLGNSAKLWC
jgi:hypothetical protein